MLEVRSCRKQVSGERLGESHHEDTKGTKLGKVSWGFFYPQPKSQPQPRFCLLLTANRSLLTVLLSAPSASAVQPLFRSFAHSLRMTRLSVSLRTSNLERS
jgi:hypothetical protein